MPEALELDRRAFAPWSPAPADDQVSLVSQSAKWVSSTVSDPEVLVKIKKETVYKALCRE